jgi:hypothetical protein
MTNQLTRVVMENIVEKCKGYKRSDTTNKMHINNKEMDMIKSVIHKGNVSSPKMETTRRVERQSNAKSKHVTLDELIGKSLTVKEEESKPQNESVRKSYGSGVKKFSLDDIVPKVSLTSIGKKR